MPYVRFASTLSLALVCGTSIAIAQPCAEWIPDIGIPGAGGHAEPTIHAVAIHSGQIYAGGNFTEMGGSSAVRIARWDGSHWSALGAGISATTFSHAEVRAIASFNGDLYAGGRFEVAGGLPASRIARWDGELWHALGSGLAVPSPTLIGVHELLVWDDGAGPALYIAGDFNNAGGVSGTNDIARWDGVSFSSVGGGLGPGTQSSTSVSSLGAFQGHLYAGGNFRTAGGQAIAWLARWDGSAWSSVPGFSATGTVNTFTTFDDGNGEALYFYTSGWGVYKFDSATTTNITGDLPFGFFDDYYALAGFDDGGGAALYIGGASGGVNHLARWTGSSWLTAAGGVAGPSQPYINTLLPHDNDLYIAGRFTSVGGTPGTLANSIAIYGCPGASACYANCDGSTTEPILNVDDFTCFINEFAAASALPHAQQLTHYANCDESTIAPVLNVDDFTCFINAFAAGCP